MPELNNTRFGKLEYSEEDVVTFGDGLIGFSTCNRFVIVNTSTRGSFRWLQSIEQPSLAFLVVDPSDYVQDYAIDLAEEEADRLGIGPETPTLLLTTASIPPQRPQDMTINLAGPIVINAERRMGRQLVVDNDAYAVKHHVFTEPARAA